MSTVAQVISHSEVASLSAGETLLVDADALVTPLALEEARRRGVTIARSPAGAVQPGTVRQVTRQVVAQLARTGAEASPELVEAIVGEVLSGVTGAAVPALAGGPLVEVGPGIDYCAACLEQERERIRTRAVLTTTGRNTRGIVARVTSKIAELSGDILDISQTLVGDYFTMIIVVDTANLGVPFAEFKRALEEEVQQMGLSAMIMHEDVVNSLHRV
jgi:ACT domain-containing protein